LIECEKVVTELSEMSPLLKLLAQMEQQGRKIEAELATKATAADECLSAPQIARIEELCQELGRVSKDSKQASRAKQTIKSRYLPANIGMMTYKNIAQRHYDGCVEIILAMIQERKV
jgi:hypothetical protein